MSTAETAVQALYTALAGISGPVVLREPDQEIQPDDIPAAGLLAIYWGDQGEPIDYVLSPIRYEYAHAAEIEVYTWGNTDAARRSAMDTLLGQVSAAVLADVTLGGTVNHARIETARIEDRATPGAVTIRGAIVPIILYYETAGSALA